jgi:hypothetical protein
MTVRPLGKIYGRGMLRSGTPIEDYRCEYALWVKREDLSCVPPGPPFSKARGVYARVSSRPEKLIGVLDTRHSQAGWAVARACQVLGKQAVCYYPDYKDRIGEIREPQLRAEALGSVLAPLPAGRSAILYHRAKKDCESMGGYMMPNALKLEESVTETAAEVPEGIFDNVLIAASSATIAAGVIRGFAEKETRWPKFLVHLGYSRSVEEVARYILQMGGKAVAESIEYEQNGGITIIDEGYAYKDKARPGETPPWPCNEYYDLKAFRWWLENRRRYPGNTLFWNIG